MSQRDRKALDAERRKIARTANYVEGSKKSDPKYQPVVVLKNDDDIDKVAPQMTPLPAQMRNNTQNSSEDYRDRSGSRQASMPR